jgi:nitrate reductase cytochrome c-type subunit
MKRLVKTIGVLGVLVLLSFVLYACGDGEVTEVEVTREVPVTVEVEGPTVEVTRIVETTVEVPVEVEAEMPIAVIPFFDEWVSSPHNRAEDEAFVHWNEDGEVSASCAKCHSTPGYLDYIGADGSEANVTDAAAPLGSTIECQACHNAVTVVKDSVLFPSGVEVTGLGDESRCMECHQGRNSAVQVKEGIENAGLTDDVDAVSEDVGFSNIHYYAAAATQYGTVVMGGYEYEGKSYDSKNEHVAAFDTCIECHNPHTLEVQFEECQACHAGLESEEDLLDVRMAGSLVDYDGDGDMSEGVYYEIEGLRDILYSSMQAYSGEVAGATVVYNADAYPYFFDEAGERYGSWTARLAKAAYNYQVSLKDPGRFAHGPKYIIQLLYDSIEDLNAAVAEPVDMAALARIDHGHFAGSEEAFRHWDEDGAVPASCSRCHSAAGLPLYLTEGVAITQPTANGFNCATCHNDVETFTRYEVGPVEFPSGAELTLEDSDANMCLNCHQGRSSAGTVDARIGATADDEVSDSLGFINIHYFAAGATLFGTEAKGAYEFAGNEYLGRNEHVGAFDTCIECHNTHALTVEVEDCGNCHEGVASEEDLMAIRISETDFDGDGDVTEGIAMEISALTEALYAAMQGYAEATEGVDPIVYNSARYPYFFNDAGDRYATWTPTLPRGAYNYQYAQKDPGAFAHNGQYVIQVLYDSIAALGGDVSTYTRP